MKPIMLVYFLLMIPMVILDVALFLNGKLQLETSITMLVTFAAIIIIYYFLVIRRGGQKVEKDERTIKLNSRAAVYSWQISIYVVCLLMGLDTLGLLRLTGLQYLGIVAMTLTYSYGILLIFISRKGDVQ